MRMDGVMRFKVENVKGALLTARNLGGAAMDRLNEVLPRERMTIVAEKAVDRLNEVLPRERMKIAVEKAEEASLALQSSAGEVLAWFDEVFLPYLIAAMVVAVVVWFCLTCSKCCLRAARGSVKMMKAPGRAFLMIPRAVFETNPRGYFINLRANP